MSPDAPKPPSPGRAALGRLTLGHFIAYPVGFLAAVGSMPLGMILRERALLAAGGGATSSIVRDAARDLSLSPTEAAQVQILLEFSLWTTLAVLLVIHLAAVPWAVGAARTAKNPSDTAAVRRGLRAFVGVTLATAAVVGLMAVVGWVWVLTL